MRMGLSKKIGVGLFIAAFSLGIKAQEEVIPLRLTLDEAVEIALNENPSVLVANQEIKKRDYAKKEVLGSLLPQIDASGQFTHTIEKQSFAFPGQGTIKVGTANQWAGGFSATLPLIAPTLWKSITLTQQDIELALEEFRNSKIEAVAKVKDAFYAVLLAQDSHDVLKRSYDNAVENYEDVRNKFNNGIVAEYDMIRANVRVKSLEPSMIQAENAVNLTKMQLKVLMGIDLDINVQPVGRLNDYEYAMYGEFLSLDENLVNNSSLRQFDIQTRMVKENLNLQKMEYLPTLGVSFLYQWVALNEDFTINGNAYNPYSTVSLSLSVPIFSGGKRYNKIRQTRVTLNQMQIQRQDLIRNLELAIRNYKDALVKNIEAAAAAKEGVSEAEKGYQIALKMYDTGIGTMLEVNDADLARVNANLQYNQAIYDYLSAKANLEMVLGDNF